MPTAAHVHPRQEETYAVQEGVVEVLIGREWFTIETGRSARVPAGTPHAFRNRSGATVRFLNEHRPALRFEEYFRTVHGLADASKVKGGFDVRGVLYACVLMEQYDDTIQPARGMQRLAIGVLAAVARLLRISGREQAQTRGPRPSPASARGNVTEHPPPYGEKISKKDTNGKKVGLRDMTGALLAVVYAIATAQHPDLLPKAAFG